MNETPVSHETQNTNILQAEITRLRAELTKVKGERTELIETLHGTQEIELAIRNGTFTMEMRSNIVRMFARTLSEFFIHEEGQNFLEIRFTGTRSDDTPMGEIILTFQRANGITPAQALSAFRADVQKRFRRVNAADAVPDTPYLILGISPGNWRIWQYKPKGKNATFAQFKSGNLAIFEWDFPHVIREIYELREPDAPDTERLPDVTFTYIVTRDTMFMSRPNYDDPLATLKHGELLRGIVCRLIAGTHNGKSGFFILPAGETNITPATLWFPESDGVIPDYLKRYGKAGGA